MGKASREKGKRGEREVAELLRACGYEGRRGQQFCGINGDADVLGIEGVHIEVKRVEAFKLWDAMKQAQRDAKPDEIPTVWHRKNNERWVVVLDAEDFLKIWRRAND